MIRFLLSSCLTLVVGLAYCQRIVTVESTSTIRLEQDMSKEEARDKVREMAMITAIESEFGVYVDSETNIEIADGKVDFHTLGDTRLKGEWLKTNSEKFTEEVRRVKGEFGKEYETWITINMRGKIREVSKAIPAFVFKPLVCPSEDCEKYTFSKRDPFYLYFRTPESGYLSVFIREGDKVYRLFPYQDMGADYVNYAPVLEDQEYMLFSLDHLNGWDNTSYASIDELYMDTDKESELMKIYVIFSKNPIPKPILEEEEEVGEEYILPKSLTRRNFEVWLQDNRIFDEDFYYKTARLKITP